MHRFTGLFLLAVGLMLALFAVIGLLLLLGLFGPSPVPPEAATALGLICVLAPLVVGGLFLYLATGILGRTKPFAPPRPQEEGRAGGYLVGQVENRRLDGRPYRVEYRPQVGKQQSSLAVRVAATSPTTLQFNAENWFDRLCKWAGLANEHQTGDREFDDAVYVRGPSLGFAKRYLIDKGRRRAIIALLKAGFRGVQLTGTEVEANWPLFDPASHGTERLAEEAGRHLLTLSGGIPEADPDKAAARGDPGLVNAVWLWLAAAGLACTFVLAFVYPPVRVSELVWRAAMVFAAGYPLFGWVAAWLLRGASTSHDRWAVLMAVAVVLLGLGSVGGTAALNALNDRAEAEVRMPTVSGKRVATGKGNSRSYYASVPDWAGTGTIEFRVTAAEHGAIVAGRSRLELTTGQGSLGFEWVLSKRVLP